MTADLGRTRRRIAIVQRTIADYRVAFYRGLHAALASRQRQLTVFASPARTDLGFSEGLDQLPFGVTVRRFGPTDGIYYQPLLGALRAYDMVIVEQANGALLNFPLLASRWLTGRPSRLAFWGHGQTMQAGDTDALRQGLKRRISVAVDHWFAYTQLSADIIASAGYPSGRITVVNNSVPLGEIEAAADAVAVSSRPAARQALGLNEGPTAVFCSRLYAGKGLDFLLAAAERVQAARPDFQLLLIGDGPLRGEVDAFAAGRPWIRVLGARYGAEKAEFLAAADVMLLPSWVGLSVLDGFAAGLPVVSARFNNHSPEIVYLKSGVNGLISDAEVDDYAAAVGAVLADPAGLARMSAGARDSARTYSLDAMVARFADGVEQALDTPPATFRRT